MSFSLALPDGREPWSDKTRRRLWIALFAACYLFGVLYHIFAWQSGPGLSLGWAVLYELAVIAAFIALGFGLHERFRPKHVAPARTFWTTFLVSLAFVVLTTIVGAFGRDDPFVVGLDRLGFEPDTATTMFAVVKNNLLSILEGVFAIMLLVLLRDLVLFKRTSTSQRNWRLMLLVMGLAAFSSFGLGPEAAESNLLQQLLIVPAVILMVINSFRLSWIAFLSFREKMACIGLSLLLLIMLGIGFAAGAGGAYNYVGHYSYPLRLFVVLSMTFGIIYSLTALLSLLFHLPTTSDFQQKTGEIAAMHTLTHFSNDVFDRDRLAARIVASAVDAGTARSAWPATVDSTDGTMEPQIVSTHGRLTVDEIGDCIDVAAFYRELARSQESILLDEATADHRVHAAPGGAVNSLLALPLRARGHMLGALFVAKEVSYGFERDDVEAVSVFAAQAALAFDNARLFEEQIEKERLARELAIARDVQQRLLPQSLPDLPGVSFAASSIPALEVGGDYYDFVELGDHAVAVIIADVSGKGSSAAFYMAELQGIFHALSPIAPAPGDFLPRANQALASALERHVFVSVVYGVLDLQEGTFTFARAGHCPIAFARKGGDGRLLRPKGLGLGLETGPLFKQTLEVERMRLEPDDTFVMYTDGVIESRDDGGEEYGYDRLVESLCSHRNQDARSLHNSLVADLRAFTGPGAFDDDMTMAVIKWRGVGVPGSRAVPEDHPHESPSRPGAPEASSQDGVEQGAVEQDAAEQDAIKQDAVKQDAITE